MGLFNKIMKWLGSRKRKINLVFVGLDNAGKSTIIKTLKEPKSERRPGDVAPTFGYALERLIWSNTTFHIHDMAGQSKYRDMWSNYYTECDAIVFVLDSSDKIRVAVAKSELDGLLNHPDVLRRERLPVLFFANKTDLRNSMSAIKCAQAMGLNQGNWIKRADSHGRPWHICSSNALTGDGLDEGMNWVLNQIVPDNNNKSDKRT